MNKSIHVYLKYEEVLCFCHVKVKVALYFHEKNPQQHIFFHISSSDKIKNQRTEGTEESAIKKTFVKEAVLV